MDSKTVFELRKESQHLLGIEKLNKLNSALKIARDLYSNEPYNEWNQKAFAWVLIDLCKFHITEKNLNLAGICFKELNSIDFQYYEDAIIENQKNLLRPKIDIHYSQIQRAEELSKNGNHQEALAIFKNLIFQNRLTDLHHESYGWVIYRYIKSEEDNLSSIQIRTFLRDYINLKNERPSMLHSTILNFALHYSKTHSDFNFYKFFLLWNPEKLRSKDFWDGHKDEKKIPSLISRICKELFNSNTEINLEDLLSKINGDRETILDFFRESAFWNIFNTHKEDRFSDLWNLFEQYNNSYSKYGQSKWHSEILNLAERFMIENDEWRFLNFFKNWNPENLRNDDWKETKKDEHTYKPLAIKAIKKVFEILKTETSEHNLSWIIQCYDTAVELFLNDEWLLREKALLHFKNQELETAINIYKQLTLKLSDEYYIWQELASCIVSDNSLKIGILSKALSLQKNENFLGDIRLDLAKTLIEENLLENALVELEAYRNHRKIKGWKLCPFFDKLYKNVSLVKLNIKNNQDLYKKYILFAENFAYADIEWKEFVLVDKWNDDKGKERLNFTDGKTIEFAISKNRFEVLRQLELGQIFKFKLHKQEIKKEVENTYSWMNKKIVIEYKYIPLVAEKTEKKHWEILEDTLAIVDYINKEKNIIHAITTENKEVFFPQIKPELQIGDFVTAKSYIKKVKDEDRVDLRSIQKVSKDAVISNFPTEIAVVDGVNQQKQLFHFVISSKLQGIIKYADTDLRPKEGSFIKISFVTKTNKDKKLRVKVLNIESTEEINTILQKEIVGLLEVKYKNKDYDEDYDEDYDYEWLVAITKEYLYQTSQYPTQEEINCIFDIIKLLINQDNNDNLPNTIIANETEEHNNQLEIEITDDMFDKKGKLLLDKLYPDLYKEEVSQSNTEMSEENENIFYEIALNVIEDNEEIRSSLIETRQKTAPDFAFIEGYYVPKYLLEKHNIVSNCNVKTKIIFTGEKWKVIELQKI